MTAKKTLLITINPRGPLHLGNESVFGNFEETSPFIPGSVIQGAVAKKIMGQNPAGVDSPDFQTLFAEKDVLFGNAYPGQSGPVYPFPLTAQTCKQYPGMPSDNDQKWEIKHGVYDLLIQGFLYELLVDPAFPARAQFLPNLGEALPSLKTSLAEHCPKCGVTPEPVRLKQVEEGYYIPDHKSLIMAAGNFVRRRAHVGINRARHVAEDSLLFTHEVIEPPARFYARLVLPIEKETTLATYLAGDHALGRGRSRGQGQVKIGLDPFPEDFPLAKRVAEFNEKIQMVWSQWSKQDTRLPKKLPGTFFALTLRSPAILENFGQPTLIPAPLPFAGAQLLRAWSRPIHTGGWDMGAGLPRRTRLAAKAGSVYLFHWPEEQAPLQALQALEEQGLGDERPRGYGQVEVCAPIHVYQALA